jgi:hypothetical protein
LLHLLRVALIEKLLGCFGHFFLPAPARATSTGGACQSNNKKMYTALDGFHTLCCPRYSTSLSLVAASFKTLTTAVSVQIIGMGAGAAEEIKGIAKALFMQLEKDKPSLAPLDSVKDREHCINFALRIFKNADRADCAGLADLNTCKAYYAASIFLQVAS